MERHQAVTTRSVRRFGGWCVFLLALAVLVGSFWTAERALEPVAEIAPPAPAEVPAPGPAEPESVPEPAPVARELPLMPRDPHAPVPVGPLYPHPITEAHARIYRENNLLGALNGALDVEDAPGLRRLLAAYRDEYPEDPHALQAGYAIIADCLEHPGDEVLAVAHRYYESETASTLRRYVRRHCFERRQ